MASRRRSRTTRNRRRTKRRTRSKRQKANKRKLQKRSTYTAGTATYRAKKVVPKTKRVPRVGKRIRTALMKAVEPWTGNGTYKLRTIGMGLFNNGTDFADNVQSQFIVPWNWDFTVDNFYNASTILFGNGLYNNITFHTPTFTNRNTMYPDHNEKLELLNCHISYELKNCTLRTMHIKVIESKPKQVQSWNYTDPTKVWTDNGATYTASAVGVGRPTHNVGTEWDNCLAESFRDRTHYTTMNLGTSGIAAITGNRFGALPQDDKCWNKKYVSQTIKEIILEPGQVASVFIKGPSNLTLDLGKYTSEASIYDNIQKFSRAILFLVRIDNVTAFGAGQGHYIPTTAGADPLVAHQGLVIERLEKYSFICPSPGLGKSVVIEDIQTLSAARSGAAVEPTDEDMEPNS